MPITRFLFFSSKRQFSEAFSVLRRFGPSKRIQSRNYVKSSRHGNGKPDSNRIMNVDVQAPRSWGTYVIPAALLGFAGLGAFLHYNDERRAIPKGQGNNSSGNKVMGPIIGGPFTLIDTENQTFTERNLCEKWVLLYFGYTSSPDVGPEQVQVMAKAIDKLDERRHGERDMGPASTFYHGFAAHIVLFYFEQEARHNVKVLPVFVTIDPQRDTPQQLRAYLKEFDPRIVGLTGPISAVREMARRYRVYYKKVEEEGNDYLVETFHNMYLLNPNMEIVRCFGVEYNEDKLVDSILEEVMRTQS